MTGFEVHPDHLRKASKRFHELADDCAIRPSLRYSARAELAGDGELAAALEGFQSASASAMKVLLCDTGQLGERLHEAARRYEEHEAGVRFDLPGELG